MEVRVDIFPVFGSHFTFRLFYSQIFSESFRFRMFLECFQSVFRIYIKLSVAIAPLRWLSGCAAIMQRTADLVEIIIANSVSEF